MGKKILPGQRDGENIGDYVRRTWETEPGVQEEFGGDYEAYEAFCRAEALGLVKILSKGKR